MGLSPPPGLGIRLVRCVRHCSGTVSRTPICLTMKARLALATSSKTLSPRGVQESVPIPLLLRKRPRGSRPSQRWDGEHAQPLRLRHDKRGGLGTIAAAEPCRAAGFSVPLVCPQLHRCIRVPQCSAIAAILSQQGRRGEGSQALRMGVRRFLASRCSLESPFPDCRSRIDPHTITGCFDLHS